MSKQKRGMTKEEPDAREGENFPNFIYRQFFAMTHSTCVYFAVFLLGRVFVGIRFVGVRAVGVSVDRLSWLIVDHSALGYCALATLPSKRIDFQYCAKLSMSKNHAIDTTTKHFPHHVSQDFFSITKNCQKINSPGYPILI